MIGLENFTTNLEHLKEIEQIGISFGVDNINPEKFIAKSEEEKAAFAKGYAMGLEMASLPELSETEPKQFGGRKVA